MNFTETKNGSVDGFGLIKSIEEKLNVKGVPYLDIILCDKTGEINAKLWDYKKESYGSYSVNDVVKIRGSLSKYNGVDQLRIDRIRPVLPEDEISITDLVPSSEYDGSAMLDEIKRIIETFKDEELKSLTSTIISKHENELVFWPAAFKLHHAMRGGLLYHTLSIVRMAECACRVYPSIDRDLLLSGAILHDIAKIREFQVEKTGIATGYSIDGNLLGHLVMGAMEIKEEGERLNISHKTLVLLEHMVISHHGEPDFGAAVRPMFIEAEILCQLDTMDATVYEMAHSISEVQTDDFTQRQWALDNRKLYNHGRLDIKPKANLDI